jgi:hypothetical protein
MKITGLFIFLCLFSGFVWAQNFSAAVSPPRFELKTQAGKTVKQTFTLFNMGFEGSQYHVSTNDWKYNHGQLSFHKELLPGSCREWVKLERHKISVPAGKERKFRFEVHVPPNTPTQECRFAIMVEGTESAKNQVGSSINLPVNGRLALIVYLAINGAKPQLAISQLKTVGYRGMTLPALQVVNKGNAHGRLQGTLAAKSADGKSLDFSVSTSPIMVGDQEQLLLMPSQFGKALDKQNWQYPLQLDGKIYWEEGAFEIKKKVSG